MVAPGSLGEAAGAGHVSERGDQAIRGGAAAGGEAANAAAGGEATDALSSSVSAGAGRGDQAVRGEETAGAAIALSQLPSGEGADPADVGATAAGLASGAATVTPVSRGDDVSDAVQPMSLPGGPAVKPEGITFVGTTVTPYPCGDAPVERFFPWW